MHKTYMHNLTVLKNYACNYQPDQEMHNQQHLSILYFLPWLVSQFVQSPSEDQGASS